MPLFFLPAKTAGDEESSSCRGGRCGLELRYDARCLRLLAHVEQLGLHVLHSPVAERVEDALSVLRVECAESVNLVADGVGLVAGGELVVVSHLLHLVAQVAAALRHRRLQVLHTEKSRIDYPLRIDADSTAQRRKPCGDVSDRAAVPAHCAQDIAEQSTVHVICHSL